MANTYDAYQLFAEEEPDAPFATVWWHGKIRCSDPGILSSFKDHVVDGLGYTDGRAFFDKIPSFFRSGYVYVKRVKVDAEGKEV